MTSEVVHGAEEILHMVEHARQLRIEQQMFAEGAIQAKDEGRLADAKALTISKWSCVEKASAIERALRGLPRLAP